MVSRGAFVHDKLFFTSVLHALLGPQVPLVNERRSHLHHPINTSLVLADFLFFFYEERGRLRSLGWANTLMTLVFIVFMMELLFFSVVIETGLPFLVLVWHFLSGR